MHDLFRVLTGVVKPTLPPKLIKYLGNKKY